MRWLGYSLGLVVGGALGFWLRGFWEELTGVGSPPPPSFDLIVPVALLIAATATLAFFGGRRG
jgi:hypothetical protein